MTKIKKINKFTRTNIAAYGLVIIAFAILYPMQLAGEISSKMQGLLVPICAYIVLALSLNLTVGVLGELSLGHAGFMSVGAFSGVIASAAFSQNIESKAVCLLLSIIVGGIFAAIAGVIVGIPVLRLRGDYLAIVTLAFGEIIKNVVSLLYVGIDAAGLHFSMKDISSLKMTNGRIIINGPQGAVGVTKMSTFVAGIILILFTLFIVLNLINSRAGRAITAIRDNRIAAESIGLGVTKYKLLTFVISASLAGMAGALYSMNYNSFTAAKFDFNTSILILVFVVLGGMGNMVGSIIATTILYMLPEVLREFSDYRMLIYAIVLILVMLVTNSQRAIEIREKLMQKIRDIFFRNKSKGEKEGAVNE